MRSSFVFEPGALPMACPVLVCFYMAFAYLFVFVFRKGAYPVAPRGSCYNAFHGSGLSADGVMRVEVVTAGGVKGDASQFSQWSCSRDAEYIKMMVDGPVFDGMDGISRFPRILPYRKGHDAPAATPKT